jgi:hypothetical protein
MKTSYLHFTEAKYNSINNARDRSRVLAVAAGMAAAWAVSIPSAPVENLQQYYNLSTMPIIQTLIEETNENLVMEFEEAMEYALMFWRLRYIAAHPNATLDRATPYGFFDTILGVNLYVDKDSHTFVNQYMCEIFQLRDMLCDAYERCMDQVTSR